MTTTHPAPGLIAQLRVLFDREDSVQAAGLPKWSPLRPGALAGEVKS